MAREPKDPRGDDARPDDWRPDDEDRSAILARRRTFIAVALAGITSVGCEEPAPQPCLAPERVEEPVLEQAPPQVCLSDIADPQPVEMRPILPDEEAPANPDPETESDDPSEEDEDTSSEAAAATQMKPSMRPAPRVCLRLPRPRPDPVPTPCLNVRLDDE
ncbi:MAG: hypothetical protein AAGF12_25330 [Myxococcota bacterium]